MNILKLFEGYTDKDEDELFELMSSIANEVAPLPIMLTDVYAYDAYEFVTGRRAPRDVDFHVDEAGNIWLSSRRRGRDYDVVPASDLAKWLDEKSQRGTIVGVIVENRFSTNMIVVSLPDDDHHKSIVARHAGYCDSEWDKLCRPTMRISPYRGAIVETTYY